MLNSKELIIFDWDGTVMDSVGKIVATLQGAARHFSVPEPTDEAAKNIIGLSLETAIATLFPEHSQLHPDLVARYKHHYVYEDNTPTPLFAEVETTLAALKRLGYRLAVATGKSRKGLDRLLAESQLTDYFEYTRTSCEAHSKPHPDMLEQILTMCDVSADKALMIGDTQIDMQLAANAKVDAVGVTFGVHNAAQLQQFSPVATVDHFSELRTLLQR
mgnify:CR=1 FL=1